SQRDRNATPNAIAKPSPSVAVSETTDERKPDANASGGEPIVEKLEGKALNAVVAPLVREHLWLGNQPPPRLLAKDPGWNMGREISVFRQLANDYGQAEMLAVIPILREQWGA